MQPQFLPPHSGQPVRPSAPVPYTPVQYAMAQPGIGVAAVPQRPAVIGASVSMAATASALWVCALATGWLFAVAGQQALAGGNDMDGQLLLILNHFSARLLDGLAVPLFAFPALAFGLAFLLLSRRNWARIGYTVLGVATIGWAAWWLRDSLGWWFAPAAYVGLATALVWSPAATRWYGAP